MQAIGWTSLTHELREIRGRRILVGGFYDEVFDPEVKARAEAWPLVQAMEALPAGELLTRQRSAERALLQLGITFNVYGDNDGVEKIFPFDIMPRIVAPSEWSLVERDPRPRTIDFLVDLNRRVFEAIGYIIRLEPGVQTPEETLSRKSGSCRDSAWLLCQLFRHLGVAARFVSGYLIQLAPDVKSLDGPSGADKDFTDLHAWCEVYLPGAGWIGLDPTSGLLAGEGHIPLAATPDPQSAAPISGVVDECECEFDVSMTVTRIHESPRVTRPYTVEQWQAIAAAGHCVDLDLKRLDCRLTMGGEPTFVSIDNMDGDEWNMVALGPEKRRLADELLRRLKGRMSRGAMLHHGQGKWYPGESLPRWVFGCFWRKDGEAVWEDDSLLAKEGKDYGHGAPEAERFIRLLAGRLGCGERWIMPAFEDAWYYLWRERRLPVNVDPFESKLGDKEERARLAAVFERGLDRTVGFVLPLQRAWRDDGPAWGSGPWFLRPERCYLTPGDSPMGLRLPLDSLPWVSDGDRLTIHEQDPLEPRGPLPPHQAFLSRPARESWIDARGWPRPSSAIGGLPGRGGRAIGPAVEPSRRPAQGESAASLVRTAVCVEPRQGRLHVFLPPVELLEDYLECVAAVEATAAALQLPVVLEGYPPPFDPRLHVLKITPDPGVIEVNIHPAESWDDLVRNTEVLYEEARLSRLGTEKFMVDGRHTGTGGGNHIVLGGPTPAESPLLQRPGLLRSLVAYWQNHPALSFLFSGLFIGPTSQSPRADEARNDSLYELGVAFNQMPKNGNCSPWMVDRLFRHLLVDATGNTHRAEFCIDKLYPPDGNRDRLGLLELRAFEMPPHAQMSLAQQLLLRALVARFWRQSYTADLVRWGTDIHDRWMLPHFVWDDLGEVLEDLRQHGYPLQTEWFAPHFEFRFPRHGEVEVNNVHLELRQALEPWHVLGEESGPGGTVRYVDSSVERMQVKVHGLVAGRHVVCVGGHTVPLHPTGTNGEAVAGVRYRAWQPPNCLHPTIGVHTPLVFDIVDQWNRRSLGGCTYHVMHPGGRNYTTFPVNAYEAESRRLSRFFRMGHTPGVLEPRPAVRSREFPFTLDLRAV
ncbi:MAG: transglutaminase family protein [Limisphaerales bacterium]